MYANATPHATAAPSAPTSAPASAIPGHLPGHGQQHGAPSPAVPGTGWQPEPAPAPLRIVPQPGPTLGMYAATGDAMIDRMLQLERALKARAPLT